MTGTFCRLCAAPLPDKTSSCESCEGNPFVKRLVWAAIGAWTISLALTGFVGNISNYRIQALPGILVLALGLPGAWLYNGWAVYANIFFLSAAVSLFRGKRPLKSTTAMVLLALTLPLFTGNPLFDELGFSFLAAWGWGAVVWLISILLLAIATLVRINRLSSAGVNLSLAAIGAGFIGVMALHHYQFSNGNAQELETILIPGVAFSPHGICGVPFAWPTGALLDPDSVVSLEVEPMLVTGAAPNLFIPNPRRYVEDGHLWVVHRHKGGELKVRYPAQPASSTLSARETPEGAEIRLADNHKGEVLYKQEFRIKVTPAGISTYCPMGVFGRTVPMRSYSDALTLALGVGTDNSLRSGKFPDEEFDQVCNVGADLVDGIAGLYRWDDREVLVGSGPHIGFCSKNYAAIVNIWDSSNQNINLTVNVHDRATLSLLAKFHEYDPCSRSGGVCKYGETKIEFTGLSIREGRAVVKVTGGELFAGPSHY